MPKKRAFTLIELLVVISVVALLMGIMMPALNSARKQGRKAVCLSQLKQWSLIWQMYFDENNGTMPSAEVGVGVQGGWHRGFWVTVLREGWEKRPKILKCPSATQTNAFAWGDTDKAYYMPPYLDVNGGLHASYGMNLFVCSTNKTIQRREKKYHWQNQNRVKHTSDIPVFMDSIWRGTGPHYDHPEAYQPPAANGQWKDYNYEMQHVAIDRHGGGINVQFLDGSVRKVRVRELWNLRWHRGFNVSRADHFPDTFWPEWMDQ